MSTSRSALPTSWPGSNHLTHFKSEVREIRHVDGAHSRWLVEMDGQTWEFDATIAAQHPEEPEVGISIHVPIRLRWLRAEWLSVRDEIRSHLKSRDITTIRPTLNIANRRTTLTIALRPFEFVFSCSTGQVDQMRCSPCAFRPRSLVESTLLAIRATLVLLRLCVALTPRRPFPALPFAATPITSRHHVSRSSDSALTTASIALSVDHQPGTQLTLSETREFDVTSESRPGRGKISRTLTSPHHGSASLRRRGFIRFVAAEAKTGA